MKFHIKISNAVVDKIELAVLLNVGKLEHDFAQKLL